MKKNQFLKVKSSLSELVKDFIKFNDRELKDREVKIKRGIKALFFKSIIVSIDNMDNFKQKEMKKIRLIKKTRYDWFIDYIPEPIRKSVGGFKNKVISLFKTNTPKNSSVWERKEIKKTKNTKQNYKSFYTKKENKTIQR